MNALPTAPDAVLTALLGRIEALDERVRRLDAALLVTTPAAADTKLSLPPSALTPPVIPWPIRDAKPPRGWSAPRPDTDAELLRTAVGLTCEAVVGVDAAGGVRLV